MNVEISSGCATPKVRYASRKSAAAAARRIDRTMQAYRCPDDDHWHIGHSSAKYRRQSRIASSKVRDRYRQEAREKILTTVFHLRWVLSWNTIPEEYLNRYEAACVQLVDRKATWDEAAIRTGWTTATELRNWFNRAFILAPLNTEGLTDDQRNSVRAVNKLAKKVRAVPLEPDLRLRYEAYIALVKGGVTLDEASVVAGWRNSHARKESVTQLNEIYQNRLKFSMMRFAVWLAAMEQIAFLSPLLAEPEKAIRLRPETARRLCETFSLVELGYSWNTAASMAGFPSDDARRAAMRRLRLNLC